MSVAVNYYAGLQRGQDQTGLVLVGTASGGTAVDVEIRMQIDNGTAKTGLTRMDVIRIMRVLEQYIDSGGQVGGQVGTDLPSL